MSFISIKEQVANILIKGQTKPGFEFLIFFIYLSATKCILIIIKLKGRMRGPSHKVQDLIKVRVYSSIV